MAGTTEAGNQFTCYASRCNTVNSVRNMYKKSLVIQMQRARIIAYSSTDSETETETARGIS
ncbi:hypothetical protein KUTeg_014710 [Tegillarca granosa]|uniref:Uncharacterized protein n=1 Tax=Tegillarca granosa TaxID=220873 RepID=A0ABQ9ERT8_TEGGR|nr:hypothetical protein KUTeg_014710 [Tegillarca granosa]